MVPWGALVAMTFNLHNVGADTWSKASASEENIGDVSPKTQCLRANKRRSGSIHCKANEV